MLPSLLAVVAALSGAPRTTPPESSSPPSSVPDPAGPNGNSVSLLLDEGNVALVDDTGSIFVGVPESWSDTDMAPIYVAAIGADVPRIVAAPDRQAFADVTGPGLEFVALPFLDDAAGDLAERYGLSERGSDDAGDTVCADVTEAAYEDPVFTGTQFIGTDCGDAGATWYLIIAAPVEEDFTVIVDVKTLTAADEDAYATILETFNLTDLAVAPGASVPGEEPGDEPGDESVAPAPSTP
jgi:hypothetical protein